MRLLLCNEVVRELPFEEQCVLAAELGYHGLELAPFTFGDAPHRLPAERRRAIRRAADEAELAIGGLHWLLVAPEGLSITDPDPAVRSRTLEVIDGLVELCAELGGRVLVHGSPKARIVSEDDPAGDRGRARDAFAHAAAAAERAGVVYCVEPLAREETNFVNTLDEADALVREIGSPALKAMIDCKAARSAEEEDVPRLLDRWLPTGRIAHVHLNDRDRSAPGQGNDRFLDVLRALARHRYDGAASVEPFTYRPDGPTTAAWAAGYLAGLREALAAPGDDPPSRSSSRSAA